MASENRRLASNAPGDFFVDDTCIDCGACRWIAPKSFDAHGGYARVFSQPQGEEAQHLALAALVACPTGSIGTRGSQDVASVAASFPRPITAGVHHCGFHSEKSFGAASYFIVREGGNVLVDSPRFHRGLVRRMEALGGIAWMFLTHRDDVAEHQRFAAHFGCRRVLHRRDLGAGTRGVEVLLEGDEETALAEDLRVVPTPGHTRGSACLLYAGRFLFSGDHVAFSRGLGHVYAFADACWYDWGVQIASMEKLARHRFEHILPGHGAPCHFSAEEMQRQMRHCIQWMRESGAA